MQNRAYSKLEIKSFDDDLRIIRGTATTPQTDRMGDIIEPLGVQFKNPLPLLWQHKHDQPVGSVNFKKPTKNGIEFEARVASIDVPGTLKNRLDEAWQSVKLGLVGAVSVGFRAIEYAFLKESDGIHFQKTEVWELSLVTIPANTDATISQIRSLDTEALAASGYQDASLERPQRPGVTGKETAPRSAKKMTKSMTIAEQIAAYEATRAAKSARMTELMTKAGDAGATLDEAESQEYDGLEKEVAELDKHLGRLRTLEKANKAAAVPVIPGAAGVAPEPPRQGVRMQVIKPQLPKGTSITRYVQALGYAKGDSMKAINFARQFKDETPEVAYVLESCNGDIAALMQGKAPVAPGTTYDATWASPLIVYQNMVDELIELLRPATIIGRAPLHRVPFNIQMPATTTGSSVNWVGEQAPKPVSAMAFTTVTLRWSKAAGIVVLTDELVRFSNPAAEGVVRRDLVRAMAQFLDRQFVDPAVAEVTNVSPASITNGVSPVTPTGTAISNFISDVKTLLNNMLIQNLNLASGFWIMTQQQALALSLAQNALGQPVYSTINAQGGTLLGYPVIASENMPAAGGSPADGYPIIFAIGDEIMLADDGQTVIDASNQASVQMESAPDSPPTSSTNLISLWQMNMTGVRAERWINWKKRRSTSVGYIQAAHYG